MALSLFADDMINSKETTKNLQKKKTTQKKKLEKISNDSKLKLTKSIQKGN